MKRVWTKEMTDKLIELYAKTNDRELVEIFGLGRNRIRDKANRLKLKKETRKKNWSEKDIEDLKKYYPNSNNEFLIKYFDCPISKIYNKANQLAIHKSKEYLESLKQVFIETLKKHGKSYRFKKKQEPWNKGVKGYMGANVTSFKKGMKPKNYVEVGSERTDKDGYTLVKINEPSFWELKHRLIWKERFGEIPDKHAVIFMDGNKGNFDLSNLVLVHRRDLLFYNRHGKYPPEIMETQRLIYQLKKIIKNAKEQD
jgi:hypothetical protein